MAPQRCGAVRAVAGARAQARFAAEKKGALVAECEAELSKVMPPLIKALKELRAIDKASIAELKVRLGRITRGLRRGLRARVCGGLVGALQQRQTASQRVVGV